MTGLEKWKVELSRTQTQNTGDTGLRPSGNWNGPKRATPTSRVSRSFSGTAPLGMSSVKSLELLKNFTPSLVVSDTVEIRVIQSGMGHFPVYIAGGVAGKAVGEKAGPFPPGGVLGKRVQLCTLPLSLSSGMVACESPGTCVRSCTGIYIIGYTKPQSGHSVTCLYHGTHGKTSAIMHCLFIVECIACCLSNKRVCVRFMLNQHVIHY